MSSEELRYPENFPPTGGWDRFFLGVRWLGPDTSFFKDLRKRQASRTAEDMSAWGSGDLREIAMILGEAFSRYCGWPTPYFLPNDVVTVVANGPSFGWMDTTDTEEAVRFIEEALDLTMGAEFWQGIDRETMSDLVSRLLAAKAQVRGAGV